MLKFSKPIICTDGFEISVQASASHYCSPRIDGLGFYDTYELGFPSEEEPLITPYAEDPDNLTGTVYADVPALVVARLVMKHYGVKGANETGE